MRKDTRATIWGKTPSNMDRLENPYRPGAGTAPPALLGRDELIDGFGVTMRGL